MAVLRTYTARGLMAVLPLWVCLSGGPASAQPSGTGPLAVADTGGEAARGAAPSGDRLGSDPAAELPAIPAVSVMADAGSVADPTPDREAVEDAKPSVEVRRRPERFCTITVRGDAQCVSLADFPARPMIERLLRSLGHEGAGSLTCGEVEAGREKRVKRLERRLALPKPPPRRAKLWESEEWSLISHERVEQNIVALLRSCHAVMGEQPDPVARGEVAPGAPPRGEAEAEIASWSMGDEPAAGEELEPVVIHEPMVRDADGLPTNPFDPPPPPPAPEDSGLEEEIASGMYDTEGDEDDAGDAGDADEDYEEYRPDPLPRDVHLVDGYDVLRPNIARLVFTWTEYARDAAERDCSDPLAVSFGSCEL